jgi:hypothetical protein
MPLPLFCLHTLLSIPLQKLFLLQPSFPETSIKHLLSVCCAPGAGDSSTISQPTQLLPHAEKTVSAAALEECPTLSLIVEETYVQRGQVTC